MRRLFLSTSAVCAVLFATVSPAFANVVQPNGPGKPTAVYSNPGSVSGQTNRSATGTTSKFTHDGFRVIMN